MRHPPGPSAQTTDVGAWRGGDDAAMADRRMAMLVADGVEREDVEGLRRRLEDAGARVDLVALHIGEVWAMDGLDKAGTFPVDVALRDARAEDYDCLLVPGGIASVDHLRRDPAAVALVYDFAEADKPIAATGHAPWLLIDADLVAGRTLASSPSLRRDVSNAGGHWVDRALCVEGNLLTGTGCERPQALSEALLQQAPAR